MTAMNIRLDIEYDGTSFSGWQRQKNAPTVQEAIEQAIEKVTGQKVALIGAGRTDSGVHALNQVAGFRIDHSLQPEKYRQAINFYLPKSILVVSSRAVEESFHARKSARRRHYRYIIGLKKSALFRDYRWEYEYPLNLKRMNRLADYICGTHDFSALCVVSSLKDNNECRIEKSVWRQENDQLIYDVKANRFLHTMVRSLVGSMVDAGRSKDYLTLKKFKDIMNSGEHTRIKTVAPARGLYLVAVEY
jgi:tRNA pseudouridine38-40 synthase